MNELGNISTLNLSPEWTWQVVPSSAREELPDGKRILRDELVQAYATIKNVHIFNGPTVCLMHIDPQKKLLNLQRGQFYDLLINNILGSANNDSAEAVLSHVPESVRCDARSYLYQTRAQFAAVRAGFTSEQEQCNHAQEQSARAEEDLSSSLCAIINSQKLANTIAVSVFLRDQADNYLITQRTSTVAIGKDLWGVSASGSLEPNDVVSKTKTLEYKDPFCACAAREIEEELGIHIPSSQFATTMLMLGDEKFQPIALVDGAVPETFDLEQIKNHIDKSQQEQEHEAEVRKVHCMSKQQLAELITSYRFSQAAYLQIRQIINPCVQDRQ